MTWQLDGSTYTVKAGSIIPSSQAQEIGEYIQSLGYFTPESVVKDARREESPLHPFFEWDDQKAGEQWRLQQARLIVNHFEITVKDSQTDGKTTIRAWHSVNIDVGQPVSQRVYVGVAEAMSQEKLRRQVVGNALRELRGWRDRYNTYQEFEPIFTSIQQIETELD